MKVLVVSSTGGHLTDLVTILSGLDELDPVWVVNDASPVLPRGAASYRIHHAERGLALLWNLVELARVFAIERPRALLSAGASPAVPAAIVARLAGLPVIYVEASCAVTELTLTGRLMRRLATVYFVQWESLLASAPSALRRGRPVIVVVTGTSGPFARLLEALADYAHAHPRETVWAQHGAAALPAPLTGAPSVARTELLARMEAAEVVVCHAGCGTIADVFRAGRVPVVVPRRAAHGEHINDHQLELLGVLERAGRVVAVHDMIALPDAIERARGQRPTPGDGGVEQLREAVLDALQVHTSRPGLRQRLVFAALRVLSAWVPGRHGT